MPNIRKFRGYTPEIAEDAWVDESAVVIGEVKIGSESSVWPQVAIRGDIHHIHIGERTNVQDGSILHVTHASNYNPDGYPLTIGDDVTIGHNAVLHGCTIQNRSLIGMGSTVLDGAVVESNVIVGAGSLVPPGKVLESGHLYVGSPVKQARPLKEAEMKFLGYSAENYAELAREHAESED